MEAETFALAVSAGIDEDAGLLEVLDPDAEREAAVQAARAEPIRSGRSAESPLLVVRPTKVVRRPPDPALEARLVALAEQFDVLYDEAQAADGEEVDVDTGRGLFGRRRHRHHH